MDTLHSHLTRPRIYYTMGLGWTTDRWYDQGENHKKNR